MGSGVKMTCCCCCRRCCRGGGSEGGVFLNVLKERRQGVFWEAGGGCKRAMLTLENDRGCKSRWGEDRRS